MGDDDDDNDDDAVVVIAALFGEIYSVVPIPYYMLQRGFAFDSGL